jgi:hypothetical protein
MWKMILLVWTSIWISSCTLGPKVETRTVYVDEKSMCIVAENTATKVDIIQEDGSVIRETWDLGGMICMSKSHYKALRANHAK